MKHIIILALVCLEKANAFVNSNNFQYSLISLKKWAITCVMLCLQWPMSNAAYLQ